MDIVAVRAGLARAAAAVPDLNATPYAPDSMELPAFYPGESEIDFDMTFGAGVDEGIVTCYVMTSAAEDESGQKLLDEFLGRGARSIKAALEADRTLGGAVADLRVRRFQAYRKYASETRSLYGAQIPVYVIGQAEE